MTGVELIISQLQAVLRELDERGETLAALRIAEAIEVLTRPRDADVPNEQTRKSSIQ